MTHFRAVWLMVLVTLLWATAGMITRHLAQARGFEITFWRSFFTSVSLLVILPAWQGGPQVFRRIAAGGRELWISGICWAVMFTAFMIALTLTSTANVLVTMALGPLLTALFARVAIGHRLPVRTWMAIMVAGAGIGWMYGTELGHDPSRWLGTLVALCVPIAAACNWTVVQHAHARGHDVDLVPAVLIGALVSCAAMIVPAWPLQANAHDLALLAFLGLFQLAVPCVLSVQCARVLKAPEVALLALLEVVFGIMFAWVGAGERPASTVLVGGALVVGALAVNEWLGWRRKDFVTQ